MKKIFVFTTDGPNREDGNVYYSNYVIVESSPGKNFDEDIFSAADDLTDDEFIVAITALGYIVETPEIVILEVKGIA